MIYVRDLVNFHVSAKPNENTVKFIDIDKFGVEDI